MSFEEIQSIWDAQEPLDNSIDEKELHAWIQQKQGKFSRIIGITEIVMTLTLLFVSVMFLRDPILQGHDRILIIAAIASLAAASFVWTGRIARKKREIKFDESLVGIVDRSIDGINYHIWRMRSFPWWFALPCSLGLAIGLIIVDESKRYLFYTVFIPGFIGCIALCIWQIRKEINQQLAPEKQRLEQLRKKLTQQ